MEMKCSVCALKFTNMSHALLLPSSVLFFIVELMLKFLQQVLQVILDTVKPRKTKTIRRSFIARAYFSECLTN
jgi:hypothetical protein